MTFTIDTERVISAARQLLALAKVSEPPVPIDQLAGLQGVLKIIYEPIDHADAELIPAANGYAIRVDNRAPRGRQRFSIAHEIAHTFYPQRGPAHRNKEVSARRSSQAGWGYRKEEKLCDIAAAEMLMPRAFFFRELEGREPSIELITHLSRKFDTSVQSTLVRYTELCAPRAQIVRWTKRKKGLRAESVRGEPVVEIQPMSFVDADSYIGSNVHAAYSSQTTVRAFDFDPDSSPPERIWIESRGFGRNDQRYVLTILRSARIG